MFYSSFNVEFLFETTRRKLYKVASKTADSEMLHDVAALLLFSPVNRSGWTRSVLPTQTNQLRAFSEHKIEEPGEGQHS